VQQKPMGFSPIAMIENKLKKRLVEKKASYGVISPTTDPTICEYIGLCGMDFYIMDAEHGALTVSEVAHMIRACETVGITPLARINSLDEKMILQYFDAGCMGVMMPGTNTVDDCRKLVECVKYYPQGKRGLGPVRAADYMAGKLSQAGYLTFSNEQTLVFPMIETKECLQNLSEMVKVDGVDGFILGPRDLALSMGFTDGPAHDEVKKVINEAIAIVTGAGKIFGTVAATAEQAKELTDKGVTLLLNSVQGLLTPSIKSFMSNKIN
jgi:4-hydroxy-2-oxoheptanedioate aldolase